MVKRGIITGILALGLVAVAMAQPYGNEWINYNQQYYKVKVAVDGLYRLTYDDLSAAGFPVNTVDPRRVQLYHRGVEQAIRINGQLDARWDPGDYLEFYGRENDGTQDAELYLTPEDQPHPYYNLYSDTTAYFLTWRLDGGNGRRMEVFFENNVTNIPAEVAHTRVVRQVLTSQSSLGRVYPEGSNAAESYLTEFDMGEGFTGNAIARGQSVTYTFTGLTGGVESEGLPQLRLLLQGRNNREHNVSVLVGPNTGALRNLATATWDYYRTTWVTEDLAWTDISAAGELVVRLTANGVNFNADRISASVAEVSFPQAWDGNNLITKAFGWNTTALSRSYVEVVDVPDGARFFDVTVPSSPRELRYNRDNSTITMVAPVSATQMDVRMEAVQLSAPIERIAFRNYPATADYLMVTHTGLRQATADYADPVSAYAAYRASATGGSYDTLIANVQELYNQFSYGEISPLAIRRFVAYQLSRGNPRYLFLIGKSRYWFNNYFRASNPSTEYPSWFPAAGYPGSDAAYTYGLAGNTNQAALATGRLNARQPEDVATYLDKIRELEAEGFDDPWRKRLLHLSGGASTFELSTFAGYIDGFAAIAQGKFLGADISSLSKTSDAVVEVINVSETVNEGVGVLLMFGHSGAQRTDIDIGYVSNPVFGYDNQGRYPLILVNGCNAGDIFQGFETFGEDWMTTPNLGASTVIAHSATGFSIDLRKYSDLFYQIGFADSAFLDAGIGEVMQEVSARYIASLTVVSERQLSQVQQMVLQGDPAVRLFGATQPDLRVAENGLRMNAFEGQIFSAAADSLALRILLENVGITSTDSVRIAVQRTLPDGTLLTADTASFAVPDFLDTVYMAIPNGMEGVAGSNRFEVWLDPQNLLPELNELNNRATLEVFIPAGTHLNLLPGNRAIVSASPVRLLAQANDVLAEARPLDFQLDTVATFNSPFRRTSTQTSAALMAWEVSLPPGDSVVYYWRTRFADLQPGEDTVWQMRSFVYVPNGPEGWAQAHPGQFAENGNTGLVLNEQTGDWSFETTEMDLEVLTYGDAVPGVNRTDIQVTINGQPYIFPIGDGLDSIRYCRDNSLNAIAFDRQTAFPYLVINDGGFDVLNANSCGRRPQIINNFRQEDITSANRELNDYLNGVAEGDWVLLFSIGTLDYGAWQADVITLLEGVGVSPDTIASLQPGEPWIFLGQKRTTPTVESLTAPDSLSLTLTTQVVGQFTAGSVASPRIGPATAWGQLDIPAAPLSPGDFRQFDLYGILPNGQDTLLLSNVGTGPVDISAIDADQWPQLRLRATLEDEMDFSPPPFRQWWLTYTAPPEGILLPDAEVLTIDVQEGTEVSFPFQFYNLSSHDFTDSLPVTYRVTNVPTRQVRTLTDMLPPVAAGDTARFVFRSNTVGWGGGNDLQIGVNDTGLVPEQNVINNTFTLERLVQVSRDSLHPILDVTVDGRYLFDGEIVSPSPLVVVRMRDENELLRKTDTVGVNLFFRPPCDGCDFTKIPFSDPRVTWTPAAEDQDFRLEFQPRDLEDGQYTLRVQATDATGNASGAQPNQVAFRVVNEATVTRFYPYPNPFSTSCRFVFTLTGSSIPDEIKVQILTVSGKVVREITQDELGPIHIGNNLTEFAWDGTDQWGQRLGNGVYLYRVIVRNAGETVTLTPHETDEQAFTKDFGKLYILR